MKQPPSIHHIGVRPQILDRIKILDQVFRNFHVCPKCRNLMLYYADQKTGFRPELATVRENVHIPENHVSEYWGNWLNAA